MNILVIDASALLSYLFGENNSVRKEINTIIRDVKLKKTAVHSSPLLSLEIGNAIKNKIPQNNAEEIYKRFKKIDITYDLFTHDQLQEIIKLAYQFDTTVYDTSYHYLAKLLDGTFVTCDRDYFNKAKSWGNIKLL